MGRYRISTPSALISSVALELRGQVLRNDSLNRGTDEKLGRPYRCLLSAHANQRHASSTGRRAYNH